MYKRQVLDRVIAHMEKYGIEPYNEATGKGLVRHVLIRYGYFTKEVMVCLILNGNKLPKEEQLVKSLCEIPGMTSITINVNKKRSNVILGEEICLLWGQELSLIHIYWDKSLKAPITDDRLLQERILPEVGTKYPYLTIGDFLEDNIIFTGP